MRVFVSEFVCGGGWPESSVETSLVNEGRAMLVALLCDLERLSEIVPVTTWDSRQSAPHFERTEVHIVDSPADEWRAFQRLASESDATVVIAPETGRVLLQRLQTLARISASLGCEPVAAQLLSDKFATFLALTTLGLPTIPTRILQDVESGETSILGDEFPRVVKPQDGAGCLETFVVANEPEFDSIRKLLAGRHASFVVQPFVSGESISIAAVSSPGESGQLHWTLFPIARQLIRGESQLSYSGGEMPHSISSHCETLVRNIVQTCCERFPGLQGYVGFDLILSDAGPVIVDINPRLTTSYLGYREHAMENLAPWITGTAKPGLEPTWDSKPVVYGVH